MIPYLFSLDLGKQNDPSSLQVWKATIVEEPGLAGGLGGYAIYKDVLVTQKQYLKVRYTDIVEQVVTMLNHPLFVNMSHLVFDCTGVGQAVKDMFYEANLRTMTPVNYTAGGNVKYVYKSDTDSRFGSSWSSQLKTLDQINVPKADLVSAAKASLEMQEIEIPLIVNGKEIPFLKTFQRQMEEFTGKMGARGYVKYNNSSDDIHDDWVNCFMLRSWWRRNFEAEMTRRKQNDGLHKREEFADIIGGLK